MNIYILYHSKEREMIICEMIAKRVREQSADAKVIVTSIDDLLPMSFDLSPDVVFLPPIRDERLSALMTSIKLLFNCKIICLVVEGVENFENSDVIAARVGQCTYPLKLIDCYYCWGPKPARIFGEYMFTHKRISQLERVKFSGYPLYERNAVIEYSKDSEITKSINEFYDKYGEFYLFVTGFYLYSDPVLERINGSCFPAYENQEQFDEYASIIRFVDKENQKYRDAYIDCIYRLAKEFPDKGFIAKFHPVEISHMQADGVYIYDELEGLENVLLIKEPYLMGALFPRTKLFFHYGSTTGIESYLYRIPSVLLSRICLDDIDEKFGYFFGQTYFHSTEEIVVNDYDSIRNTLLSDVLFDENDDMNKYLYNLFSFDAEQSYEPTMVMAQEILEGFAAQPLDCKDPMVVSILSMKNMLSVRLPFYKRLMKFVLHGKFKDAKVISDQISILLPSSMYWINDVFAQFQIWLKIKK